jgi:hypothetical protein
MSVEVEINPVTIEVEITPTQINIGDGGVEELNDLEDVTTTEAIISITDGTLQILAKQEPVDPLEPYKPYLWTPPVNPSGEANVLVAGGTGGVELPLLKTGSDLNIKNIAPEDARITIIDDVLNSNILVGLGDLFISDLQDGSNLVTVAASQVLTNKILDGSNNTFVNINGSVINTNSITFSKISPINQLEILGRKDAGSGDIQALLPNDVRNIINVDDGAQNNTASNAGLNGISLVLPKNNSDLPFKSISSVDPKIIITDDILNNSLDIELGTLSTSDLSNGSDIVFLTGTQTIEDKIISGTNNQIININADNVDDSTSINKFNITHTGDVAGASALTAQSSIITSKPVETAVNGDFILFADASDGGNLKRANAADFIGGGGALELNDLNDVDSTPLGSSTLGTVRILADITNPSNGTPTGEFKVIDWSPPTGSGGEVNDGVNIGTGVGFYEGKAGSTLRFRTLVSSAEFGLVQNPDNISLSMNMNSIANSKLSMVAEGIIKGRIDTGTGNLEDLSAAEVRAIINVEDGATQNSTDAALRSRATHTGTQTASTILDFDTAVSANSDVLANTAKISNANHSGDMDGDTSLTANVALITGKTSTTSVSGDQFLIERAGTLFRANVDDLLGSGEANTASSGGTGGIGLTLAKSGVDLPFKNLINQDAKITVTNDAVNSNVVIGFGVVASTDLSNSSDITLNNATQTLTNKSISGTNNTITNINADNVDDGTSTNKFTTTADISRLANTSGTNTGDETTATQTSEGIAEIATVSEINTGLLDDKIISPFGLAGSQLAADVATNNAKQTNATHLGHVTGAVFTTLREDAFNDQVETLVSNPNDMFLIVDQTNNFKRIRSSTFVASPTNLPVGLGAWIYDSNITTPPTDQSFRFNNADPTAAATLNVHYTDSVPVDRQILIREIAASNTVVTVREATNPANFLVANISFVNDVAGLNYFSFQIGGTGQLSGSLIPGNQYIIEIAAFSGSGGGADELNDLTDVDTVTAPQSRADTTLRVLGDVTQNGTYEVIDWSPPSAGGGEINFLGTPAVTGIELFLPKTTAELPLKNLIALDAKILVADDVPNNTITVGFGSVASSDLSDSSDIVILNAAQILTNKTISGANNTFSNINGSVLVNNSVTITQFQQIAQDRIMGRVSTGTGNLEALTAAQTRTLINVEDGAQVNPVNTDGLPDTATNRYTNDTDITRLANTSGTNTGDEVQATQTVAGISEIATTAEINAGTLDDKIISPLGLANSQLAADVSTNNSKISNANHTGEVTGSAALTIASGVVDNDNLSDMAANTIKGRESTTGTPTDLTAAQVRSIINVEDGAQVNEVTQAELDALKIEPFPIGGLGFSPINGTYIIEHVAKYAYTIEEIDIVCDAGSCTVAIAIDGTNVTGLSSVSVTTTSNNVAATAANTVAIGQEVTIVVSAVSGINNLTATLNTTRS